MKLAIRLFILAALLLMTQTRVSFAAPAPPVLSDLTLDQDAVTAGKPAKGTVRLSDKAPLDTVVVLTTDNMDASPVLASSNWGAKGVVVPGGKDSAAFVINTNPAAKAGKAKITATLAQISKSASLTLTVPARALTGVALDPGTVPGGKPSKGTVTLSDMVIANTVVALASDNKDALVAPSVTVPPGKDSAVFAINTNAVKTSAAAKITATLAGVAKTASLALTPTPCSASAVYTPAASPAAAPANGKTVTVTLKASVDPTPGCSVLAARFTMGRDGRSIGQGDLSVAADNSISGKVDVPAPYDPAGHVITFTVMVKNQFSEVSRSGASMTLTRALDPVPAPPALKSLELGPTSLLGGQSLGGFVWLTGKMPGDTTISLASDNPNVPVPARVTVPAGLNDIPVTIKTSAVSQAQKAVITASQGGISKTAAVTLFPVAALTSLSVSPASVQGGQSARGTVALQAATNENTDVALVSDNALVTVPKFASVPPGQTSAAFAVATSIVDKAQTAAITATLKGVTQKASLSLTLPPPPPPAPPPLSGFQATTAPGGVKLRWDMAKMPGVQGEIYYVLTRDAGPPIYDAQHLTGTSYGDIQAPSGKRTYTLKAFIKGNCSIKPGTGNPLEAFYKIFLPLGVSVSLSQGCQVGPPLTASVVVP